MKTSTRIRTRAQSAQAAERLAQVRTDVTQARGIAEPAPLPLAPGQVVIGTSKGPVTLRAQAIEAINAAPTNTLGVRGIAVLFDGTTHPFTDDPAIVARAVREALAVIRRGRS